MIIPMVFRPAQMWWSYFDTHFSTCIKFSMFINLALTFYLQADYIPYPTHLSVTNLAWNSFFYCSFLVSSSIKSLLGFHQFQSGSVWSNDKLSIFTLHQYQSSHIETKLLQPKSLDSQHRSSSSAIIGCFTYCQFSKIFSCHFNHRFALLFIDGHCPIDWLSNTLNQLPKIRKK